MSTQEKMFAAIEHWQNSGKSKTDFLADQDFSEAKFNYWISKWKRGQRFEKAGFEPVNLRESQPDKVLEIVTAGGLKISVFA